MGKKLYVGNLSYETTDATLAELFREVGEVVSANVVTDRMTGRSRGFGFVEMANEGDAQTAIGKLNGRDVGGRDLKVAEARPKRPRRDMWDSGGGGGRDRY